MALRPLVTVPRFGPLAMGMGCFVFLFAIAKAVPARLLFGLGVPVFLCISLVSGFLVGYTARQAPLMHGAIVGVLTGVLTLSYTAIVSGFGIGAIPNLLGVAIHELVYMTVAGTILCVLGATIGDSLGERRRGL